MSKIASTVASTIDAHQKGQEAKRQQEIENQPGVTVDPKAILDYNNGVATREQGSVALDTTVITEGHQANAPQHETFKTMAANPGYTGQVANINLNKTLRTNYPTVKGAILSDGDTKLTAPNGREFTGPEALNDPYLMSVVQQKAKDSILSYFNITEPQSVAKAMGQIEAANVVELNQAAKGQIKLTTEIAVDQADTLVEGGTVGNLYSAFQRVKNFKGAAAAHDFLQEQIEDPNTPQATVDKIGNLVLGESGKRYADEWPNRWGPAMQARNESVHKLDKAEEDFRQYEIKSKILDNIEEIREAYDEDPEGSSAYMQDYFHSEGMTVPALVKLNVMH